MAVQRAKLGSSRSKLPILVYNITQLFAWLLIILKAFHNVAFHNYAILQDKSLVDALKIVQASQYLDVLFCIIGISHKNVGPSLTQVTARNSVVWFIFPYTPDSTYPTIAVVSWGLIDITRFSNYVNDIMNFGIRCLKHLRYNAFLLLYPSGLTGEVLSASEAKYNIESQDIQANMNIFGIEIPINVISFIKVFKIMAYPSLAVVYSYMLTKLME